MSGYLDVVGASAMPSPTYNVTTGDYIMSADADKGYPLMASGFYASYDSYTESSIPRISITAKN
ncbi:MAG: hypothetical protein WBX22_06505 [Silvibacterium sp.]|jgi:hypothetical protein